MAGRKRRTYGKEQPPITKAAPAWETAIYARLSVENSNKDDNGESIEGQVEICRQYIEDHAYLRHAGTYIDNGWTGVNTNRPEFQRLLGDIQSGKIKALVIKDFSRFSRDYIEAGNLLENIFPAMGIRFISVADRYDSYETDGSASSLLIPLKNLINSFYSKDMSKKVSTAVHTKQLVGEHIPSMIPYGYKKSETREYRFEPDPETAPVVTRIFKLCAEGTGYRQIASILNKENIPCPGRLRYMRGQTKRECYSDCIWSAQLIKQVLRNPTYLGNLVFGRMPTALYLGQPDYHYEPDESKWRVLSDMHEPLIDKETFELVKRKMEDGHREWEDKLKATESARAKMPPFFHNIIFCGDCGVHLTYTRNKWGGFYYCRNPQYGRCTGAHTIQQEKLKRIVWQVLKDQLTMFTDFEKVVVMMKETDRQTNRQSDYTKELQELHVKIKQRQRSREKLYEDYTDGILSAEDYVFMKQKFDNEYQELNTRLNTLEALQAKLRKSLSGENAWFKALGLMKSCDELTPELLAAMVEKVLIYDDGKQRRVEVVLKYRNDAETLLAAYNELIGGARN